MNTIARGSRRNSAQRRQQGLISGPAPLSSHRRRRSISPDPHPAQQQGQPSVARKPDVSFVDHNKRKKSGNPSLPSSSSMSFPVVVDDVNSDHGRKSKTKSRSYSRPLVENPRAPEPSASSVKRERSKSGESPRSSAKGTVSDAEGSGREMRTAIDAHSDYNSSFAVAEFVKIKQELDSCKKLVYENKKTIKKQCKLIEEYKQQDNALKQKLKECESQLLELQSRTKKSEEVITTVECNSQCQICMELLHQPHALSPCGHILCVSCLQEWFRKAPTVDDEIYDGSDPDYLLRRRKTCPCCRTNIRYRPIPVFMIKAIVAAIAKTKGTQSGASLSRESVSNDSDPWQGLFPDDDDEIEDYGATDDEDEDLDEDEEDSSWYDDIFSYGSGSEGEVYQGDYVYPRWEPPTVVIDEDGYLLEGFDECELKCLQRGATAGMIQDYDVEYHHDLGLIVRDEAYNRIYLGWNIRLSADDENGELYMQYVADNMVSRSERWNIIEDDNGGFEAHLLVPEGDVVEYQDTDSDNYMDED